jgi:hypothetical protein
VLGNLQSATKNGQMRSAFVWDIMQHRVVILYQRFRTTCRSHKDKVIVSVGQISQLQPLLFLMNRLCKMSVCEKHTKGTDCINLNKQCT